MAFKDWFDYRSEGDKLGDFNWYNKEGKPMNEVNTLDTQMAQAHVMAGAETKVPKTPVALQPEETVTLVPPYSEVLVQTDEDVGPISEDVVTVH